MLKKIIKQIKFRIEKVLMNGFVEYHHFDFDVMKPLPDSAADVMLLGCRLLNENGFSYRLTDGTVLGLYREGQFIAHDNDIDVDVFNHSKDDVEKIIELFLKNGFSIGRVSVFNNKTQQVVFYNANEVVFDILFWDLKDDSYVNLSERGYIREQESKYFSDLVLFSYKSYDYFFPSHIDEWLVARYGKDWQTPKLYKGDWKDDCHDLTKI